MFNDRIRKGIVETLSRYPSLTTNFNSSDFLRGARLATTPSTANVIEILSSDDPQEFMRHRRAAESKSSGRVPRRIAVVSGLSVPGLLTAAILSRSGYRVVAYEQRRRYSRNLQWTGRQAVIDQLGTIDTHLASEFLSEIISPLASGVDFLSDIDNSKRTSRRSDPVDARPWAVPRTTAKLASSDSIFVVEARKFERLLRKHVQSMPNITLRYGEKFEIQSPCDDGTYRDPGLGPVDLIVVSEGARSSTRETLGIQSLPSSPARLEVAGEVHLDQGSVMSKHLRCETAEDRAEASLYLTGSMASQHSGRTWIVADIAEKFSPDRACRKHGGFPTGNGSVEIDEEFCRIAAAALQVSQEEVQSAGVSGPVLGSRPTPFLLQQRISEAAAIGKNVVGLGDFVGTGHWSVVGGMQVAAVCHIESLKKLLFSIELNDQPKAALNQYNESVLRDTLYWQIVGIADFYPKHPRRLVMQSFADSVADWMANRFRSPYEAFLQRLPQLPLHPT